MKCTKTRSRAWIRALPIAAAAILALGCRSTIGPGPGALAPVAEEPFWYDEEYGDSSYNGGIAIYGDSQKHHDVHADILGKIMSMRPKAILHLGDAVSSGDSAQDWEAFDTITKVARERHPFYPVIGNHEKGVDPAWYSGHWDMPIGQGFYSLALLENGDFMQLALDFSDSANPRSIYPAGIDADSIAAQILVLHSNVSFLVSENPQDRWLKSELDRFDGIPTLLVFHIPLFMVGTHNDEIGNTHPAKVLYGYLEDAENDIVACVSGHDRSYQRFTLPDYGNAHQVVTGCGGETPDPQLVFSGGAAPYLDVYAESYVFTVINYDGTEGVLKFTAFARDLSKLDEFEIDLSRS